MSEYGTRTWISAAVAALGRGRRRWGGAGGSAVGGGRKGAAAPGERNERRERACVTLLTNPLMGRGTEVISRDPNDCVSLCHADVDCHIGKNGIYVRSAR